MPRPEHRSAFVSLCAAMALVTVSLSSLSTLGPLYAVGQGAGAGLVGVLVALPNVFPIVLALTAGRLVDAGGAGRWLVIGTAGMVAAPLAVAVFGGLWALAAAQVVIGLFHLFATLSSQSFVASLSARGSFERSFSWYATSLAVGRMIGPVAAGLAVDAAGFRSAFAGVTVLALTTVALAFRARRQAVRATAAAAAAADDAEAAGAVVGNGSTRAAPGVVGAPRATVRETAANPGVQLAVLASAGVFVAIAVRQAFLPVYLQALAYPATTIGGLLSFGSLAAVLVRPLMPAVTKAFGGAARTLVVAMAAVAVAVGALGSVQTLAPLLALAVLSGFGTGVGMPLSIVTVASHVDPASRGLALGLRLSLNRSAQLVAPVAIGALIAVAGFALGFAVAGGVLAVLALVAAGRVAAFERAPAVGTRDVG